MSYNLILECGCTIYVSHDPVTNTQHSRVLERRSSTCPIREHKVGARVFRYELLLEQVQRDDPESDRHRSSGS